MREHKVLNFKIKNRYIKYFISRSRISSVIKPKSESESENFQNLKVEPSNIILNLSNNLFYFYLLTFLKTSRSRIRILSHFKVPLKIFTFGSVVPLPLCQSQNYKGMSQVWRNFLILELSWNCFEIMTKDGPWKFSLLGLGIGITFRFRLGFEKFSLLGLNGKQVFD
jgi:hypothetical protein